MGSHDLYIPGYDINERIGSGGMASVYRANQHTFRRDVALKILRQDLGEDEVFSERFIQESLIIAKLHHSHIVQVYDVGEYQNLFYVAMEFLSNGTLNERMNQQSLEPDQCVKICSDIGSALAYSHKKGIIHRDVKPDNIMFREDNAAVLTDFGIAKDREAQFDLTQTGTVLGTPKYMAPEQIKGNPVTSSADLYSLGIVFYQMLIGEVPFSGSTMVEVAFKHLRDPVPTLPSDLAKYQPIVDGLLAKKPYDRFATGEDLVKALANLDLTSRFQSEPTPVRADDDATVLKTPAFASQEESPEHDAGTVVTAAVSDSDHVEPEDLSELANETVLSERLNSNDLTAETDPETSVTQWPKPKTLLIGAGAFVMVLVTVVAASIYRAPTQPDVAPVAATDDSSAVAVEILNSALADEAAQRLTLPVGNNALTKFQQVLALDPANQAAHSGALRIGDFFVSKAERTPNSQNRAKAVSVLETINATHFADSQFSDLLARVNSIALPSGSGTNHSDNLIVELQVQGLLQSAKLDEEQGRLTQPATNNAREKYLRVLELDPGNSIAAAKLETLQVD